MGFKISTVQDMPEYEALPAAKLTSYPLARDDYRPYAQARVCIGEPGLMLQLIAFEVVTSPSSLLRAEFCMRPGGERFFSLWAKQNGETGFQAWEGDSLLFEGGGEISFRPIGGEDLQGIYWGCEALVPRPILARIWGGFDGAPGTQVLGNFYKTCGGPSWQHYGSYYPVSQPEKRDWDCLGIGCMGEFTIVAY